jgi:DNA-binding SARP family transcriptional activator
MLHISLLGEQAIVDGATGAVRTRSSRTVALLTFLVLHAGVPQTRQRIAGLFWPDSTAAQALTNLRRELYHLRQLLADHEPCLAVTPTHLCWRDAGTCQVDLRTFDVEYRAALAAAAGGDNEATLTHAAAAIALYRGELLPGMYDDWLLESRAELEGQCVALCDLSCAAQARIGDLTGAVAVGRRRIQLRPLEEVGYRTLMELQADLGDRAGALSTYHHCASVLERELGVEPDPATRRALDRLTARLPQKATVRLGSTSRRAGHAEAALIGRAGELARLQACWQAAAAGRPTLVLVRGPVGVGKTRLVADVARAARRHGAVVASSQCFGGSGRLALAPVADWLRSPAIQATTATLNSIWRVEVDRLVPCGAERGAPGSGSRAMVDAWQRHRFFEGLARALCGARRPTLLVLDNLQWCDHETLAFLAFCLRLSTDAPLMVAATLRTEYLDDEFDDAGWTARMRASGLLTEVPLTPLETEDTARLAQEIAGRTLPKDHVDLLQATTGGFPLYIVEAVRSTVDSGADSLPVADLAGVLRGRLEQATPAAQEVAGLAAAVGRDFSLDLLAEASELETDAVVRAVDELWRRRIVREFRDGYDFAHDALREAAYARISPPKRWLLHRRLAQSLELIHAEDFDAVSAQLAQHYALGGQREHAIRYYRRAADIAAARFAHAEAIRLHKAALSIVRALPAGRARDIHELAVLQTMAAPLNAKYGYSSVELREVLERSIELAERHGRNDSVIAGLVSLWSSLFVLGRTAAAHDTASRALARVEPTAELSGPAHFAFAGSAVSLGQPSVAVRHFELAADLTHGAYSLSVGTRPDVHSKAWAAHAHWLLANEDEALRCCQEAVRLARAIDHPYSLAVALAYAGISYQLLRRRPELEATVDELRELCGQYGFAYYREWALILGGWLAADAAGDVDDRAADIDAGIDSARQGIENLKSNGSFARMPYWLSLLADLLAAANRPEAARAALDAALVGGRARDDLWWLPEVMRQRAGYDPQGEAAARLRSAAELASAHGSVALLRRCERDLALLVTEPETSVR